jgi:hypothetical protein
MERKQTKSNKPEIKAIFNGGTGNGGIGQARNITSPLLKIFKRGNIINPALARSPF